MAPVAGEPLAPARRTALSARYNARVISGKTGGAGFTHIHSLVTGRTYDFCSVQTSGESCVIQSGNAFGN